MIERVVNHDHPRLPAILDEALETGKTIIFPTDTIYGIGGNPWDQRTLTRVRTLKHRDESQPFTLHLANVESIAAYALVTPRTEELVGRLLPGPYTVILPALPAAPSSAVLKGGVGIRVPDHPLFSSTLTVLDRPVFGTSVNEHGQPPLTTADEIIERFGGSVDLIISGPTTSQPSSIIDLCGETPRALRGELPPFLMED